MIRKNGWRIGVCILVGIIVVFAVSLYSIKTKNEYLQDNIDRLFSYNFSKLQEALFFEQKIDETSAKESTYLCSSIFQYTTFTENEPLREIIIELGDMVEDDSQYMRNSIIENEELIEDIGRLVLDLQDSEKAEEVLKGNLAYE